MKQVLDFLKPAALAFFAAFVVTTLGCPGDDGVCDPGDEDCVVATDKCKDGPDTCTDCTKTVDCTASRASGDNRNFICNNAVGECIQLCSNNSDCDTDEVCEELRCRAPACVSDADCKGDQCIDGECQAKVKDGDVASCSVQPAYALLNSAAETNFIVLAKNSDGKAVPYKGTVSWSGNNVSVSGDTNKATAKAVASGDVTISAKVGSTTCTDATGLGYAAVSSGSRVVVADLASGKPVSGATVVVGEESVETETDGSASFVADGVKTVSVFHSAYSFVTLVDTASNDLLVYVKKPVEKVGFKGTKTAADFARLEMLNETVRIALTGGSIPGNLIDINLDTLIGELEPTHLDIGPLNQEVPLPGGAVIGLGNNMFKGDYSLQVAPGVRTVWGLGGNLSLNELISAAGPALGGGDIEVGPILASIIPLLGKLQSGAVVGVQTPAPVDGKVAYADIDVPLNVLMRLNVGAKVPDLITYERNGAQESFEGAIVLGGALYPEQGLVPLGLTAGIDEDFDPNNPGAATGKLPNDNIIPLKMAARHSGLESGEFVALALGTSLSGLLDGGSDSLVLSGLVKYLGDFEYGASADEAPEILLGNKWLAPSNNVSINDGARSVSVDKVEGATFYRLDLGEDGKEWSVYFGQPAGDKAEFEIPEVPAGLSSDDRLLEAGALLQAVSTGYAPSLSYDGVVEFNGTNMNDLTREIDAFVTRGVR